MRALPFIWVSRRFSARKRQSSRSGSTRLFDAHPPLPTKKEKQEHLKSFFDDVVFVAIV